VIDVVRHDNQALDITVIDIRPAAATRSASAYRFAFYARLLQSALARADVPVAGVRGAIVARQR